MMDEMQEFTTTIDNSYEITSNKTVCWCGGEINYAKDKDGIWWWGTCKDCEKIVSGHCIWSGKLTGEEG